MSSDLNVQLLWEWVNERHAIYLRKAIRDGQTETAIARANGHLEDFNLKEFSWAAKGPALTRSPILQQYRFCNVFRELDRVTCWIRYNIRRRYSNNPNLWLMLAIARTINWPDTLQKLMDAGTEEGAWPGDATGFDPEMLGDALDHISASGAKVYTGAYMIRAESNRNAEWYSWTKQQYIARIVIGRLWEDREKWMAVLEDQPEGGLEMRVVWEMLQDKRYIGWGPFMAYQVVVDLRHTHYLQNAPDINTWAALGPGSRRGLNRLAGRPLDFNLSQDQGLHEMRSIWENQDRYRAPWVPRIDLSDIQNCLCETDKYLRVMNGEGRPRAQYVPGRGY